MIDLPNHWVVAPLKDIVSKLVDGSHNPPPKMPQGLPMLSAINIANNQIEFSTYRLIKPDSFAEEDRRTKVTPGDVLLTIVGAIGRAAVVPAQITPFTLQRSVAVLSPINVDPKFLMYQLEAPRLSRYLKDNARGTAQKGVYLKTLGQMPIWLPPLREQHRIVRKIEELFSELDKGVENLITAREQLKAYRQSVLKHAFEGKLTPEWRAMCASERATESFLSSKILFELQQQRAVGADGESASRTGRRRKGIDEAEIFPDDSELVELPEIPHKWLYVKLAALGVLARGKSRHRPRNAPELFGGPYPFIQTGEVKAARGTIKQYSQTYSEIGLSQSRLWPVGTLCITIAANIAETAFLGFDACFPDSVVGFTPNCALVDSRYVDFFIQATRARISAYAPATAQKNINLETLENLVIPYCSIEEQSEVVRGLDQKLEAAEVIERDVDAALARADALRMPLRFGPV
jgi:type I restriction enzyme S subunit